VDVFELYGRSVTAHNTASREIVGPPLHYGQGADFVSAGSPKLFLEQSDLLLHRLLRRMRHGFDSWLGRPCLLLLLWLRLWWRRSPRLFRPRFSRLRRDLLSGSRRSFDWGWGCGRGRRSRSRLLPYSRPARRFRHDGFHGQADSLHRRIDADYFHFHDVADLHRLPRVLDILVR